jgi:hypothetical protein
MFPPRMRRAAWLACLVFPLLAGPVVTTIQDTIYNADGSPYNGIAIITWTPFVAGNTNVGTQSVTINIAGGNLYVQLVPTTNATPAGYYSVTFTSAGNDQYTETWAVPPSIQPLTVREVLMTSPTSPSSPLVTGSAPIPESNVTGLVADLAARPIEGFSYAPTRAAVIDGNGNLEAASGTVSNCLHVDGSSGPCGSTSSTAGPAFSDSEIPLGAVNGINAGFTISAVPLPAGSLSLYRNGVLQKAGLDYNVSGSSITFVAASLPQPGDTLTASYRITPAGTPQGPPAPQVLCSGTGSATSATTLSNLGICIIPAGTLQPGDRVKISFDFSHEGAFTGFTFAVNWGNTLLVQRSAAASETFITGWAEAGAGSATCQLSVQTWGAVLNVAAGVLNAWDSLSYPINLSFKAMMALTTLDTVTLRNFTVVRDPKQP